MTEYQTYPEDYSESNLRAREVLLKKRFCSRREVLKVEGNKAFKSKIKEIVDNEM